jgi:hypothetical protein
LNCSRGTMGVEYGLRGDETFWNGERGHCCVAY